MAGRTIRHRRTHIHSLPIIQRPPARRHLIPFHNMPLTACTLYRRSLPLHITATAHRHITLRHMVHKRPRLVNTRTGGQRELIPPAQRHHRRHLPRCQTTAHTHHRPRQLRPLQTLHRSQPQPAAIITTRKRHHRGHITLTPRLKSQRKPIPRRTRRTRHQRKHKATHRRGRHLRTPAQQLRRHTRRLLSPLLRHTQPAATHHQHTAARISAELHTPARLATGCSRATQQMQRARAVVIPARSIRHPSHSRQDIAPHTLRPAAEHRHHRPRNPHLKPLIRQHRAQPRRGQRIQHQLPRTLQALLLLITTHLYRQRIQHRHHILHLHPRHPHLRIHRGLHSRHPPTEHTLTILQHPHKITHRKRQRHMRHQRPGKLQAQHIRRHTHIVHAALPAAQPRQLFKRKIHT